MNHFRPERRLSDYADLLDLPHHESTTRPAMSMHDRAAQFSAYAALVGYGDMVEETARLTSHEIQPGDDEATVLDTQLRLLQAAIDRGEAPEAEVTYFLPDARKQGGSYQVKTGCVKRIDPVSGSLVFTDKKEIPLLSILEILLASPAL